MSASLKKLHGERLARRTLGTRVTRPSNFTKQSHSGKGQMSDSLNRYMGRSGRRATDCADYTELENYQTKPFARCAGSRFRVQGSKSSCTEITKRTHFSLRFLRSLLCIRDSTANLPNEANQRR